MVLDICGNTYLAIAAILVTLMWWEPVRILLALMLDFRVLSHHRGDLFNIFSKDIPQAWYLPVPAT